jgi:Domain of unknown function (DUF4349)
MSQPESIVNEIRVSRIPASPELRERVRALAAAAPPPPVRRELPWRRISLVLVPACVAVGLAGAFAGGLLTSGKPGSQSAVGREAAPVPTVSSAQGGTAVAPQSSKAGAAGPGALPATRGRAQLYEAELTLKVPDLSAATKRALQLTRSFKGHVRSVDYGSGVERGTASLVLRIPVGGVQEAIVRFSALGTIVDQHVSITDVQPQLDKRFRELQALRDRITKIQARLEGPSLAAAERATLENDLVAARRRVVALQREQAQLRSRTSFATVSLALRTAGKAVVVPRDPGRIGRALGRAGSILLDEAKVGVYALVVGAPLLALAALGLGAGRLRRRRTEARLLST